MNEIVRDLEKKKKNSTCDYYGLNYVIAICIKTEKKVWPTKGQRIIAVLPQDERKTNIQSQPSATKWIYQ
jgi:hypothetical protein